MSDADDNLENLRAALRDDAAGVAETLLGTPNKKQSTKRTLRWGSKGSLSLTITGKNKGLWFSHEDGKGGDLLGLICRVKGCSIQDALQWVSDRTGIPIKKAATDDDDQSRQRRAQQEADRHARQAQKDAQNAAEADAQQAQQIRAAQASAAATVPLKGSLAVYYLKQVRGIPEPACGWPDSIRFHPRHRALVAIATTADGTIRAIQRVHLAEHGGKVEQAEIEARSLPAVKITNGVHDGAVVRLPGDPNGPLLLAEGPETGLAAWTSTQYETWIALGSIAKINPPIGRRVVAISDDNPHSYDAKHGAAAKALRNAFRSWFRAGIDIAIAYPWEALRYDKSDMADLILQHGAAAVAKSVQAAVAPRLDDITRLPVAQNDKEGVQAGAGKRVADVVAAFFARLNKISARIVEWGPQSDAAMSTMSLASISTTPLTDQADIAASTPTEAPDNDFDWAILPPEREPSVFVHAIKMDTGVGKTRAAREEIKRLLVDMQQRGDERTVVLCVPDHALGQQQEQLWNEMNKDTGFTVEIWRGRGAPDPTHDGGTMCSLFERALDAYDVGLSPEKAVCKHKKRKCPVFDTCSYQAPQGSPHFQIVPKVSAKTGSSASMAANCSTSGSKRCSGMVGMSS